MAMPGPARRRISLTALLPTAGLLPLVLWQIVFFVVPVALIVGLSFWRSKNYRLIPDFTFDNYAAIFARPAIWRALLLSLETAAFVTVACAILAYPVAYFIAKKAGRWRGLLLVAVIAPFWVSIVMRVAAWRLLLGERGVINQAVMALGLTDEPLSFLLYSPVSTAIGLIYAYLPLYVLPLYAAISNIHDSWIDAAMDLNASPTRTFFEVILPLSAPGLVVGAVFCFVFGLGEFVTPALLGGTANMMLAELIAQFVQSLVNWGMGGAAALVLLVVTLTLYAVQLKFFGAAGAEGRLHAFEL